MYYLKEPCVCGGKIGVVFTPVYDRFGKTVLVTDYAACEECLRPVVVEGTLEELRSSGCLTTTLTTAR